MFKTAYEIKINQQEETKQNEEKLHRGNLWRKQKRS